MPRPLHRRSGAGARVPLYLLLLVLVSAACGGGGGGGGGGTPPTTPPTPALDFTPGGGGNQNALVLTRRSDSDLNTLFLELEGRVVDNIYGIAFDLTYPAAALDFVAATEGSFLNVGGVQTSFQVVENPDGNLIIGLSRLGGAGGVAGNGVFLTLEFAAAAAGSGSVGFANNQVFEPDGDVQGSVGWVGGNVRVVR